MAAAVALVDLCSRPAPSLERVAFIPVDLQIFLCVGGFREVRYGPYIAGYVSTENFPTFLRKVAMLLVSRLTRVICMIWI